MLFSRLLALCFSSLKPSYRNDYQGTTLIHVHIIYTTSLITLLFYSICLCVHRLDLVAFLCVTVFLSTYDKLRSSTKEWIGKVKNCKYICTHVYLLLPNVYSHLAFSLNGAFYLFVYYLCCLSFLCILSLYLTIHAISLFPTVRENVMKHTTPLTKS